MPTRAGACWQLELAFKLGWRCWLGAGPGTGRAQRQSPRAPRPARAVRQLAPWPGHWHRDCHWQCGQVAAGGACGGGPFQGKLRRGIYPPEHCETRDACLLEAQKRPASAVSLLGLNNPACCYCIWGHWHLRDGSVLLTSESATAQSLSDGRDSDMPLLLASSRA